MRDVIPAALIRAFFVTVGTVIVGTFSADSAEEDVGKEGALRWERAS